MQIKKLIVCFAISYMFIDYIDARRTRRQMKYLEGYMAAVEDAKRIFGEKEDSKEEA